MAAASSPYGCHNHPPYLSERWIQDGWDMQYSTGTHVQAVARMIKITVHVPTECEYTKSSPSASADPRCIGCNYRR